MHSRGQHRARTHITHSIPFSMYVKRSRLISQRNKTVTLRFNRFVKASNETVSMTFGTRSFVSSPNKVLQRALLPRCAAHPDRARKGFSRPAVAFSCTALATIECTFPPLIAVHLHGDKSINKLPFPMSHCWLSRKKCQAATRKLSGSIPQIDANFEQLRLNCIINFLL